jgi:hypothetical protein
MAEIKTQQNDRSVETFLDGIADDAKRQDCFTVLEIMKQATRAEPKMWGSSIVGFGNFRYKYASGREGDWFLTGFSPRKQSLTLYLMVGSGRLDALLKKLGKHTTAKSCLHIKRLADVHLPTLKKLIQESVKQVPKSFGPSS